MGANFVVITYAIVWLALLAYLGWIMLRIRGVRAEVESARDLLESQQRERAQNQP